MFSASSSDDGLERAAKRRRVAGTEVESESSTKVAGPEVWAADRQSLCETLPTFRAYQGAVYQTNGQLKGVLLSGDGGFGHLGRSTAIFRAPGKSRTETDGTKLQVESHSWDEAPIRALINARNQGQVVFVHIASKLDQKSSLLSVKLPHPFCSLGAFWVTEVWPTMLNDKLSIWCKVQLVHHAPGGWWAEGVLTPPSGDADVVAETICTVCHTPSPRRYKQMWLCMNDSCAAFFSDRHGNTVDLRELDLCPAFIDHCRPFPHDLSTVPLLVPVLPNTAVESNNSGEANSDEDSPANAEAAVATITTGNSGNITPAQAEGPAATITTGSPGKDTPAHAETPAAMITIGSPDKDTPAQAEGPCAMITIGNAGQDTPAGGAASVATITTGNSGQDTPIDTGATITITTDSSGQATPAGEAPTHADVAAVTITTDSCGKVTPAQAATPVVTITTDNMWWMREVATRGIVCRGCGQCLPRKWFKGWMCDNCGFEFIPEMKPITIDQLLGSLTERALIEPKTTTLPKTSAVHGNWRVTKFSVGQGETISIFQANATINGAPGGTNELFVRIQDDLRQDLRRFALHNRASTEFLASHYTINFGMPYKYAVATDSKPFGDAPQSIIDVIARLTWATQQTTDASWDAYNEVLAVGYFAGNKMGFHDDGEKGLGPNVSSVSLGSDSTMAFRVKKKYHTGYTGANFNERRIIKDKYPIPAGAFLAAERQAVLDLDLPTTEHVAALEGVYARHKAAMISEHGTKEALRLIQRQTINRNVLDVTLRHGDMVVMSGHGIQKYLEHGVSAIPGLRFALTCREIAGDSSDVATIPAAKRSQFDGLCHDAA